MATDNPVQLTQREQDAWDTYQSMPDATDDERGAKMNMTGGAYGNLRRNAAKKLGDPSYTPGVRGGNGGRKPAVGPDPFEAVRRMAEQAEERVTQIETALNEFTVPEDKELRANVREGIRTKATNLREQADTLEANLDNKEWLTEQVEAERVRVSGQREQLESQLEQAKENLTKAQSVVAALPA